MPINKAGRAFYSLWKLSKNTTQPNIYYMRYLFNIVLIQVWFANGNAWVVLLEILESYLKKKNRKLAFFHIIIWRWTISQDLFKFGARFQILFFQRTTLEEN